MADTVKIQKQELQNIIEYCDKVIDDIRRFERKTIGKLEETKEACMKILYLDVDNLPKDNILDQYIRDVFIPDIFDKSDVATKQIKERNTRAIQCCFRANIHTLRDFLYTTKDAFLNTRTVGKIVFSVIEKRIAEYGLELSDKPVMQIPKLKVGDRVFLRPFAAKHWKVDPDVAYTIKEIYWKEGIPTYELSILKNELSIGELRITEIPYITKETE
jgi:hypothetical protein